MSKEESNSDWESTRVQNLFRYKPSGKYFARLKVGGKSIRKSLHTTVFSVAELRLPDTVEKERKVEEARRRFGNGKMTFADAMQIYRDKLDVNPDLKPKSKYYYRLMLDFITKSWPDVLATDIREITEQDCKKWIVRYRERYAPSVVNNSIGVMRAIFQEAADVGARFGNPATALKRAKVRPKKLRLPSRQQFPKFVQVIETGGSRDSKNAADLVRFLAYSGMRIGESKHVTWHDVDFQKKRLHVRGDPETGTKNNEVRVVPIPELEAMLKEMRKARRREALETPVIRSRCRWWRTNVEDRGG